MAIRVALFSGLPIPTCGFDKILRHALAVLVERAERELRVGITLHRGLVKPVGGLREILFHTLPEVIAIADGELRFAILGFLRHLNHLRLDGF